MSLALRFALLALALVTGITGQQQASKPRRTRGGKSGLVGLRHTDAMEATTTTAAQLVERARQQSAAGELAAALQSASEAVQLLGPAVRKAGYSWAGPADEGGAMEPGFGHAVGLVWAEAQVELGAAARVSLRHSSSDLCNWLTMLLQTTERHSLAVEAYGTALQLLDSAAAHGARDRSGRPVRAQARGRCLRGLVGRHSSSVRVDKTMPAPPLFL